jgi:SAM-dependent methyltransferase
VGKARDAFKLIVGRVAEMARPDLGREIDDARNTSRAPALKRAILYARLRRAHSRGNTTAAENVFAAFWSGVPASWYHDRYVEERFDTFRDHHSVVIRRLAGLIEDPGMRISRLVEIGCGDGQVLTYCAERLPSIPEVIGLDINAEVILRAAARQSPDSRMSFVNTDARAWLTEHPQAGTVLLSNNGVLEYFSQDNFDRLLQALALSPPAVVVLVEPVARDHDLQTQTESFAFGQERSFSHNHRHRLEKAGFEVMFEDEGEVADLRLILMIGVLA